VTKRRLQLSVTAEGALFPPNQQHRLLEVAKRADELGVDAIDISEHVLMGEGALTSGKGWERHHLEMAQPEPLTTLAAMAGATRNIRLVSNVVIAPLRPAGLLAKMGATLHALSQGRFTMGVSVSWHEDEYKALNVPFRQRGQILDEQLQACRILWSQAQASFHGQHVNFDNMYCSPRPGPNEHIPILFGSAFAPRLIRRIIDFGDGWLLFGGLHMSLDQKADAIARIKEAAHTAGRDPQALEFNDEVQPLQGDLEKSMTQIPELARTGMTTIRVHLRRFTRTPDDAIPVLEETATRFAQYREIHV
jgi:probable F420-dependent oxidoreductase